MLYELLIWIGIIGITIGTVALSPIMAEMTQPTLIGIRALTAQFTAIAENQKKTITIHGPSGECTLRFTANGTASKAGTCPINHHTISLRPGEGGLGYPWP
jgi:hypothetical protein